MLSRLPLQYSLRFLLLAITVASAVCYYLLLPTLHARQFAAALNTGDYQAADALCRRPDGGPPGPRDVFPGDWTKQRTFDPRAGIQSTNWREILRGERQLYVGIRYGDGGGIASCGVECTATRRGIEIGMFTP